MWWCYKWPSTSTQSVTPEGREPDGGHGPGSSDISLEVPAQVGTSAQLHAVSPNQLRAAGGSQRPLRYVSGPPHHHTLMHARARAHSSVETPLAAADRGRLGSQLLLRFWLCS